MPTGTKVRATISRELAMKLAKPAGQKAVAKAFSDLFGLPVEVQVWRIRCSGHRKLACDGEVIVLMSCK